MAKEGHVRDKCHPDDTVLLYTHTHTHIADIDCHWLGRTVTRVSFSVLVLASEYDKWPVTLLDYHHPSLLSGDRLRHKMDKLIQRVRFNSAKVVQRMRDARLHWLQYLDQRIHANLVVLY